MNLSGACVGGGGGVMFLSPVSKNDINCAISSQKASRVSINISLPVNLSPPLNQKRRTLRSSENSVLIPLTAL